MANRYNVKNGYTVIENLKKIHTTDGTKLISFDILNMYNNIPINETLEVIKKKLKNNNENNSFINNLIIIIRNICNQNYFTFNSKYYTQTKGLAMGSPISSIMSEIYIQDLENKIILGIINMHNVLLWNRYVDDILVIYNPSIKN